jgi:hypothetical protein
LISKPRKVDLRGGRRGFDGFDKRIEELFEDYSF